MFCVVSLSGAALMIVPYGILGQERKRYVHY
jgi:hypothetical protein